MRSRTRKPRRIDLDMKDLFSIVEQAKRSALSEEQCEKLTLGLRALAKAAGLEDRPRSSERTDSVLGDDGRKGDPDSSGERAGEKKKKTKKRGHGRNGAGAYPNAERIPVPHESLKHGVSALA